MAITEFSRIILKRSTVALQVPTLATSTDLNLLTPTDIFEGELWYNIPDQKLYTRSGLTIVDLTSVSAPTLAGVLGIGNTTGGNNIVLTSGDRIESPDTKNRITLDNTSFINITSNDGSGNIATISMEGTPSGSFSLLFTDGTITDTVDMNDSWINIESGTVAAGKGKFRASPTGIYLSKDSSSTSDVTKIELTDTKIRLSGITGNRININPNLLPKFADNAAALAGGLVQGDMYQTNATGAIIFAGVVMTVQ